MDDDEFDEVAVEDCDKSLSESEETNRTEGENHKPAFINLAIKSNSRKIEGWSFQGNFMLIKTQGIQWCGTYYNDQVAFF